jgi:hypothetical protein
MNGRGRKRKVSDERLLFEVLVAEGDAVFATEVQGHVALESVQGVRDRLNELVDGSEHLGRRKVSGRNLYSLTAAGRDHVLGVIRDGLD